MDAAPPLKEDANRLPVLVLMPEDAVAESTDEAADEPEDDCRDLDAEAPSNISSPKWKPDVLPPRRKGLGAVVAPESKDDFEAESEGNQSEMLNEDAGVPERQALESSTAAGADKGADPAP